MNVGDLSDPQIEVPFTTARANVLADEVAAHYLNSSYGQLKLTITVPDKVYRAPKPSSSYAGQSYTITADIKVAVTDYDFSNFDKVVFFLDVRYPLGASGVGGGQYAIVINAMFGVVVHELGHCFGLLHSGGNISNRYPFSRMLVAEEYGNTDCFMGSADYRQQDFSLAAKCELGWLNDTNVLRVPHGTSGLFRVFSYDRANGPNQDLLRNKYVGLRIAKDATHDLWVYINRYQMTPPRDTTTDTGCSVYLTQSDFGTPDFLSRVRSANGVLLTQDPAVRQGGLQIGQSSIDYSSGMKLTIVRNGAQDGVPYSDVRIEWIADTPYLGSFSVHYGGSDIVTGTAEGYSQGPLTYQWCHSPSAAGPWAPIVNATASSVTFKRADYAGEYLSVACAAGGQTVRSAAIAIPAKATKYKVTELPWGRPDLPSSVALFRGALYGMDRDGFVRIENGDEVRLYSGEFYNTQCMCAGPDRLYSTGNSSIYGFDPTTNTLTTVYNSPDMAGPSWIAYDPRSNSIVWQEIESFLRLSLDTGLTTVLVGSRYTRSFTEADLHAALGISAATTLSVYPTLQNGDIVLFSTAYTSRINVSTGQIGLVPADRKSDQTISAPFNDGFLGVTLNNAWMVFDHDGNVRRTVFNYSAVAPFSSGDENTATVGAPAFISQTPDGYIMGFTNFTDGRHVLAKMTVTEGVAPILTGGIVNSATGSTIASLTLAVGTSVTLSMQSSTPGVRYQWQRDGQPIVGATAAAYTIAATSTDSTGIYSVTLGNDFGSVNSDTVTVRLIAPPKVIVDAPASQVVVEGTPFSLSVGASGSDLTFQWRRNGVAIPGATEAKYQIAAFAPIDAGTYTVAVSNLAGTTISRESILTLGRNQLANISTRSAAGAGSAVQIAGFVIRGEGRKTVLIRASGPALAAFNVSDRLADPYLELYNSRSLVVASNDNWSSDLEMAVDIEAAGKCVGAFPWAAGSADAALLITLDPGLYSAMVKDARGGSGVALIEIYDVDPQTGSRLVNISSRSAVSTGEAVQIAGFVITGNTPRKVLVRASGPALAGFHVEDYLADPLLELYDSTNTMIATNDNWSSDPTGKMEIGATAAQVGAFDWTFGSKDAAITVTLNPGRYSAVISGVAGRTGVALVEVYEVR